MIIVYSKTKLRSRGILCRSPPFCFTFINIDEFRYIVNKISNKTAVTLIYCRFAIAMLLENQKVWEGTAEDLCIQLQMLNPKLNLKANAVSRRLNAQVQELGNRYGVRFTRSRGTTGRQIRLEAIDDMYDNDDVSDIG